MDRTKQRALTAAGWRVGTVAEFLELSDAEARLLEVKLALSTAFRTRRTKLGLTQAAAAKQLGSSQSRIAKMELGDRTVSTDLLLRGLFALGASPQEVARAVLPRRRRVRATK